MAAGEEERATRSPESTGSSTSRTCPAILCRQLLLQVATRSLKCTQRKLQPPRRCQNLYPAEGGAQADGSLCARPQVDLRGRIVQSRRVVVCSSRAADSVGL
mmetsp:Transcript_71593/g.133853  ORF Transcript_71593/g.133853 Transcript_71593/m.133853 type:complete len:102 (+) Transcript_71593:420-725(+)